MLVVALRPWLFGPIIIAGAPLSYWSVVRGRASLPSHRANARWNREAATLPVNSRWAQAVRATWTFLPCSN